MKHLANSQLLGLLQQVAGVPSQSGGQEFRSAQAGFQPSVHFKKVGRFWSARIGIQYRALAVESGEDFVWFWIGSHADYDRLIES